MRKIRILVGLLLLIPVVVYAQKKITLEAIYKDHIFSGRSLAQIKWVPGQDRFSYVQNDGSMQLWVYDIAGNEHRKILDSKEIPQFRQLPRDWRIVPSNYEWSPDGKSILLNSGTDLYLFTTTNQSLRRLTHVNKSIRDATFSPDGRWIAFLKEQNLWVLEVKNGRLSALTTHGTDDVRIGRFDWVYQEEFGVRTGFFWSPDSRHIAFYEVDQRPEPVFPLVNFIPVQNTVMELHYPKAGAPNALIRIGVVDIRDSGITWMDIGSETDVYIPRVKWLPDGKRMVIYHLNRRQNHLKLLCGDISDGKTDVLLEEYGDDCWITISDDIYFLKTHPSFVWYSERSGYTHLYLYGINGKLICPLTEGEWDVTELVYVDEKQQLVYFIGTRDGIRERHLYRVCLDGKKLIRLTNQPGTHSVNMSEQGNFFIERFSNISTPWQQWLCRADGKRLVRLDTYDSERDDEYRIHPAEFITVKTTDGVELAASIHKPADFNPGKKYPVLFSIYGGPGSQTVRNAFSRSNLWRQMLTEKGYIVFQLDNRGTGYRGVAFKRIAYRRLGQQDVEDMISGVEYLRTLPYVDADRIGIWGWSYGGYLTTMCILKAADYFSTGVAVAPVTDWHNYDSIWTERYMDLPANNPRGYIDGSALTHADKLRGKLLLIHGAADDNVHLANTMQLIHKFQQLEKQFDLMVYPRKDHSIRGVQYQLYTLITNYILENL